MIVVIVHMLFYKIKGLRQFIMLFNLQDTWAYFHIPIAVYILKFTHKLGFDILSIIWTV